MLQAIEIACGIALGLIAIAREGISFAMLRRMEEDERSSEDAVDGVHEMVGELEGGRATTPRRPVRALLCPASLKGVLPARSAAAALARGVRAAGGDAVELPVADGGEGTADALHAVLGGEWHEAVVSDPLGRPHPARWLALPDGRAVVEAAAAIGLPLLARGGARPARRLEQWPRRASARGAA